LGRLYYPEGTAVCSNLVLYCTDNWRLLELPVVKSDYRLYLLRISTLGRRSLDITVTPNWTSNWS